MRRSFGEVEGSAGGRVAVYIARGRNALLLLVACAFVAAGVFLLIEGGANGRWMAIACILFFGACALVAARQLFDVRPRLILDDVGVFDRTLGLGRIPWDEILDAQWVSLQGNAFICLVLRDEAPWFARLSPLQRRLARANRVLGFSGINLNLSGLAVDPAVVYALVHAEIAKRTPPDEAEQGFVAQEDARG